MFPLRETQAAQLDEGGWTLRREFDGFLDVVVSTLKLLAIDLRDGAQDVTVGREGLGFDELLGVLSQAIRVVFADGGGRERAVGVGKVRTLANCLAPLIFSAR